MKRPRCMFVVCNERFKWMLPLFRNSLRKWHTEEELPLIVYDDAKLDKINDPNKFYRATPLFAKELIKEYELVIKADVDQIFTGHLKHIFDAFDNYDVGVVLNINRVDPQRYGLVSFGTIIPQEYYNCGLVAMRSEKFIKHWWKLCNSEHFDRMPMREQGFLNILCHYGDYNVRCFDRYDPFHDTQAWNGILAKGEGMRMVVKNDELWLPKDASNYPDHNVRIVAYHWGGGHDEVKMNYRLHFPEPVVEWIDGLVKESN